MTLTRRGRVVVGTALVAFLVFTMGLAGRFDAIDQCAKFQAQGNVSAALDAGCSFDPLPNGEYPYTWTP